MRANSATSATGCTARHKRKTEVADQRSPQKLCSCAHKTKSTVCQCARNIENCIFESRTALQTSLRSDSAAFTDCTHSGHKEILPQPHEGQTEQKNKKNESKPTEANCKAEKNCSWERHNVQGGVAATNVRAHVPALTAVLFIFQKEFLEKRLKKTSRNKVYRSETHRCLLVCSQHIRAAAESAYGRRPTGWACAGVCSS